MSFNQIFIFNFYLPPLQTAVNSVLSGHANRDGVIEERELNSTLLLRGICRRSSKIFNLVFQTFICFLAFLLFFSPLIMQPGAMVTTDDTLRTVTKWIAWSVDDWVATDWSCCLLLFVSLAVLCDLLRWQDLWRWWEGSLDFGAKRQCRFYHFQKVTQCLRRANGKCANQQQLATDRAQTSHEQCKSDCSWQHELMNSPGENPEPSRQSRYCVSTLMLSRCAG